MFLPDGRTAAKPDYVWETRLADEPIWTQVNDARTKVRIGCEPKRKERRNQLFALTLEQKNGLILVTISKVSGAASDMKTGQSASNP